MIWLLYLILGVVVVALAPLIIMAGVLIALGLWFCGLVLFIFAGRK